MQECKLRTYFIPLLEEIECLSEKTRYNKTGNRILKTALDYGKVKAKPVLK